MATDQWKTSEWRKFRVIIPRKIGGTWRWLTIAEQRTVFVGGAAGLLCNLWRTEFRVPR